MGTEIEFGRMAFKYEVDDKYSPERYLLLGYGGADNYFNRDGTIKKRWSVFGIGTKTEVIKRAIAASSQVEGGMLRYQNGDTKPENYISNWRDEVKGAGTLEDFRYDFHGSKLRVSDIENLEKIESDMKRRKVQESISFVRNFWEKERDEEKGVTYFRGRVTAENLKHFEQLRGNTGTRIDFSSTPR